MLKKVLKIGGIVAGVILLAMIVFFIYIKVQIESGKLVKWDNQWYTKDDLAKKYPPQNYDVPAQNTPEEVYTSFRQALLDNDIEKALSFITEESREKYKNLFNDQSVLGRYKNIPEARDIKKREQDNYGNFANYYYFSDNQKDAIPFDISFIKDINGYWQIDSI